MAPMPGACEIALPFMESAAADAIIVFTLQHSPILCTRVCLYLSSSVLSLSSLFYSFVRLINATISLSAKRFDKTFFFGIPVTYTSAVWTAPRRSPSKGHQTHSATPLHLRERQWVQIRCAYGRVRVPDLRFTLQSQDWDGANLSEYRDLISRRSWFVLMASPVDT